jgi:uroporphyrinogen decarboxylase
MKLLSKKERFLGCIARQEIDRPPFWMGIPAAAALPALCEAFGVKDAGGLKPACDDDVWNVSCAYDAPYTKLIEDPFLFEKDGDHPSDAAERTLTAAGIFAGVEASEEIERFAWPDPAAYIDRAGCLAEIARAPAGYPVMGVLWAPHFQLACAAFGMEEALIAMKLRPEVFRAVIDRIAAFYLRAGEVYFETVRGKLDAVLIGNDFGTQTGLLAAPTDLRAFVFPGTRALIEQAHAYGVRVMHHSCGAVSEVIPDLIEMGADVIHPIQAKAAGMAVESLKERFGGRVSFCGGLDAQHLLAHGSPEAVSARTRELAALYPTGLIISPSHEAILPDVPPENVLAMAEAARGIQNRSI